MITAFVRVLPRDAPAADVDQVANVITNAFEDDPFTACMMGGDLSIEPAQTLATVRGALIDGEVHVVCTGPGASDIVGVALWFPPGHTPMSSDEARSAGWRDWLENLAPEAVKKWWLDYYIGRIKQLSTESLPADYPDPWYLFVFGILRSHQGKGYGKMLIGHVKNLAKKTNSPIVLETVTDKGVTVYQKLGFNLRGEIQISSNLVGATYRMRLLTFECSGSK